MQGLFEQIGVLASDEAFLGNLVIWLSAATVFVLVLGAAILLFNYFDPVRRRVGTVVGGAPEDERMLVKVATALGPVSTYILPRVELERDNAILQLSRAGFRSPMALQVYYLFKTILAIVLPLIVLVSASWLPRVETTNLLAYAMFASGIGLIGPNIVLRRLLERRMKALRNGFPDALDLLVVCVESGLGLAAAIQRVAEELGVSHPELAFELLLVNSEIRVGMPRERALKNLADRTGLEDIRGLVALLVQTMRFGTGVADALRVYSAEFRDKRMQLAEEQAAKMGTKLVFPLVLFMFPIFFIVAVGPAVLRIIDAFSKV